MAEFDEVGRTIENFASEDATVVIGTVLDPEMQDEVRVTVVATGLGMASAAARQPKLAVNNVTAQKTGTDNMPVPGTVDYNQLDAVPAVIRRNRASTVEALQQSGVDKYDIPAFLRKQAD
jgi:cell division protein FtsZ